MMVKTTEDIINRQDKQSIQQADLSSRQQRTKNRLTEVQNTHGAKFDELATENKQQQVVLNKLDTNIAKLSNKVKRIQRPSQEPNEQTTRPSRISSRRTQN